MAEKYPDEMVVMNRIDVAWAPVVSAWQQHRTSCGKTTRPNQLDLTMDSMGYKVSEVYDDFADTLGKSFVNGDHAFASDMEDIDENLLSPLSTSIRGLHRASKDQSESSLDHEAETTQLAMKAVAMTIRTLERLASRLGYSVRSSESSSTTSETLCDDSDEIDWCKGALLIQQSPESYQSITAQPTTQLGKVCRFCYLEISDYRSKAVQHTDDDWSALASCHVLACSSFKDQRAAYRCFGCYVSGVSKVLTSTAAMFDHIATCEDFIEKRRRSQLQPRVIPVAHGGEPLHRAQPHSDTSAISTPDTVSTNSAHSPAQSPGKPQSQAPPTSNPIPLPTRNPPPLPPTVAGPAHPPRPEAPVSLNSIPGTFPMADQIEKSYQPFYAPPIPSARQNSLSPIFGSTSTPRKPISTPQNPPPQSPQSPHPPSPMSPSRRQRTSWNRSLDEPSNPTLPHLPPQVKQLMEMGVTKSEAEHGLKETNWDVQQAADLIWRGRQAG